MVLGRVWAPYSLPGSQGVHFLALRVVATRQDGRPIEMALPTLDRKHEPHWSSKETVSGGDIVRMSQIFDCDLQLWGGAISAPS